MANNLFATLTRWDIEMEMGPEMLKSMMEYMVSFRHELYIKFFSDRMFLQSRSSDNTQYTEIDLSGTGVQNYISNIPEGLEERYKTFTRDEQITYRNIYITGEGVHKRVLLSLVDRNPTTPLAELLMFLGKNNVRIKVDTLYEKKIEFQTQRGMYIWWRLMDPNGEETKSVESMPTVINKIRNDTTVEKAVLTMEPGLFKRLASLGGKPSSKSGNSHTRAILETDVDKGLTIASGDNMRGRVLKLGVLGGNLGNYDELGNRKKNIGDTDNTDNSSDSFESSSGYEQKDQKEQPFSSPEIGNDAEEDTFGDNDDNSYNEVEEISPEDFVPVSSSIEKDMFTETGEVPFLTNDDISGRSAQSKEDKKKDYKKKTTKFEDDLEEQNKKDKKMSSKKKEENLMDEAITNDLTSAEVTSKTQLWLEIPFLAPILKLNGLAPIMIEMRNGKPLVIIQKPYNDMTVLLTVAPRIEIDGDTD